MQALFLAGGSGTRLWPLSRRSRPKQFHALVGEDSLIEQSVKRVLPKIPPEKIWIVTAEDHVEQAAIQLPEVPRSQIIGEPFPVGTNLAIGLGLIRIAQKFPDEPMLIGWADSYIKNEQSFLLALDSAENGLAEFDGVFIGARTEYPATCYGYIEADFSSSAQSRQPAINGCDPVKLGQVRAFREKPAKAWAEKFFDDPDFFWNTGITVWKPGKLLDLMAELSPEHFSILGEILLAEGKSNEKGLTIRALRRGSPEPIDRLIFEKAANLGIIAPPDLGWSDIGSWSEIYRARIEGRKDSTVSAGNVIQEQCGDCLIISSSKLIAAFGIEDLVIVETPEAILVARKSRSDELKELYAKVIEQTGEKFL